MKDKNKLVLQILQKEDISAMIHTFNFPWTSLKATKEKWHRYFAEQQTNVRTVCIAKFQDACIGYGSLLKVSEYPDFKIGGIPEIHDVWISNEHRRKGFGKRLIKYLEEMALRDNYKQIGLGVGLYKDYGSAQKLYVQMGYIPDGMGVTYKYRPVVPGDPYPVDDDLIIWLKKDF